MEEEEDMKTQEEEEEEEKERKKERMETKLDRGKDIITEPMVISEE